jgi:RsiW-degrading membrane proteinase PrsW (M82 family)
MTGTLWALLGSVAAGVIPTLLYVLVIWRIDRYEKEPLGLLTAAFMWGAAPAILVSAVAELALDSSLALLSPGQQQLVSASLVAPPIEEITKGLALWGLYTLARREFDGVLDGIIYGSIVGLGFAMTENVFYFMGAWQQGGLNQWGIVVLARALAFGFNHAFFTSCTGIGFGLARYRCSKFEGAVVVLLGLGVAIVTHLLHNFFVSAGGLCLLSFALDWSGVLILLAIVALAWSRERTILTTQLPEEVTSGLLTASQLETMVSHRERLKRQWQLLGVSGLEQARIYRQIVATATELAFKKHQQAHMGDERDNGALVAGLRAKLADLKARLAEPVTGAPSDVSS